MITTVIVTLIIIASILLVLLVLAQDSKGGGLVNQSGASQLMGVKKTADILEKLTWGFAGTIMILVIATNYVDIPEEGSEDGMATSVNIEAAKSKKTVAPAPAAKPTEVAPATGGDSAKK